MRTVVVTSDYQNGKHFRAVSDEKESFGETIGEALDAITKELELKTGKAVVLFQDFQPDEFFTKTQQKRMAALMQKWRVVRDEGGEWSTEEQIELEKLVEVELKGSARRMEKLADQLGR